MPLTAELQEPHRAAASSWSDYVCWTRMQAEAGQRLEDIVARKERERLAGRGLFMWGVGNAPALLANVLARASVPVRAVFSTMKSKPKAVDVAPARVVAWRRYVDADGSERELPAHVLVTSRGDSASGVKRMHFALMCRSDRPLRLSRGDAFDPNAFRNAGGTGAPVAPSQVTALLRRVERDGEGGGYEVNLTADLTGSYWVRLVDAVELDVPKREMLGRLAAAADVEAWRDLVTAIRSGPPDRTRVAAGTLI